MKNRYLVAETNLNIFLSTRSLERVEGCRFQTTLACYTRAGFHQEKQSVNLTLISGHHLPAIKISLGSLNAILKQDILFLSNLGYETSSSVNCFDNFASKTVDDSFVPQVSAILYSILKLAPTNFIPEFLLCKSVLLRPM